MKSNLSTILLLIALTDFQARAENIQLAIEDRTIGSTNTRASVETAGNTSLSDYYPNNLAESDRHRYEDWDFTEGSVYSLGDARGNTSQSYHHREDVPETYRAARSRATAWANARNLTLGGRIRESLFSRTHHNHCSSRALSLLSLNDIQFHHPLFDVDPNFEIIVNFVFEIDADLGWSFFEDRSGIARLGVQFDVWLAEQEVLRERNLETGDDDEPDFTLETVPRQQVDRRSNATVVTSDNIDSHRTINERLVSRPILISKDLRFDVRCGFEITTMMTKRGDTWFNVNNTVKLAKVLWSTKDGEKLEPGTVFAGDRVIFENGKLVHPYHNTPTALYNEVLPGDWITETQEAKPDGSASITTSIPDGAEIEDAYLYALVSSPNDEMPDAPAVRFQETDFSASQFKVAARLPEDASTQRAAYRVNVLTPLTQESLAGPQSFAVQGTAEGDSQIDSYQLVLVYYHPDLEKRAIAIYDGHFDGAYHLESESSLLAARESKMITGGRGTGLALDATALEPGMHAYPFTAAADRVNITVSDENQSLPYLLGFSAVTEMPLTLRRQSDVTLPEVISGAHIPATRINGEGEMEFDVRSSPQSRLVIDSSSDLREWNPLVDFISNEEGITTFVDQDPDAQRFFRVRETRTPEEDDLEFFDDDENNI